MAEKSYFRLQLDSAIQEIERLLKAVYVVAKELVQSYKASAKSPEEGVKLCV